MNLKATPKGVAFFAAIFKKTDITRRERPPCRSPDAVGIGNPAALRRRDVGDAVPYGYQKCSINSVGNAVPGVPGDREGRPYAISQAPRRGGALSRLPNMSS